MSVAVELICKNFQDKKADWFCTSISVAGIRYWISFQRKFVLYSLQTMPSKIKSPNKMLSTCGQIHVKNYLNHGSPYRGPQGFMMLPVVTFVTRSTFMGPCIVNVFYQVYEKDATLFNILYYCQCSICFRRFLRPSSGAQNCTHSIWYMSSLLLLSK
jgi:hypothetical protein